MCEVCECLNKGEDYRINGIWTSLIIRKDDKEYDEDFKYKILAYGEGLASMNINYCPMCGRNLNLEEIYVKNNL